jgi:hypothetical protein
LSEGIAAHVVMFLGLPQYELLSEEVSEASQPLLLGGLDSRLVAVFLWVLD